MVRMVLLFLCMLLCMPVFLAGCTSAPTAATATPVVTLSGAVRHPTPPMAQGTKTASSPGIAFPPIAASPIPTPTTSTATATSAATPVLLPTTTPTPPIPISASITGSSLPPSFHARGVFSSTTIFAAGDVQEQSGEFAITHVQAANAYGADEAYELTTLGTDGVADIVAVFQIGDHVAVRYAEDEWIVLDRADGSGLVMAIQPIIGLARGFGQIRDQAQDLGMEEVNGVAVRHLRLDDAARAVDATGQPFFQASGHIKSLRFDAWVTEAESMVIRYTFAMDISGSHVLNTEFQPVTADQRVAWSFDVLEMDGGLTLAWPEGAPTPGVLSVPGFAPGEFPIPPNTQAVPSYGGLTELVSAADVSEVSRFYQERLMALGWSVEGGPGLLRCAKDGVAFQLLITEDISEDITENEKSKGSRITVLPAE